MASNRTFLTFLNTTIHNWFKDKEVIKELYKLTLGAFVPLSEKGVADGVATLDSDGFVPISQINPIALERIYVSTVNVATPDLAGLTTNDVQTGDIVKMQSVLGKNEMWVVKDGSSNAALAILANYVVFSAGTAVDFTGSLAGDVSGTQSATSVNKINGTSLAGLSTGLLKNTTTTGVPSIAVAGTDYLIGSGSQYFMTLWSTSNGLTGSNSFKTDASNNFSINLGSVTAPTAFVVGDTGNSSPRGMMSWQSSSDTNGARFHLRKSNGTFASPSIIVNTGVAAVTVNATGTGYTVGDVLTLSTGGSGATVKVRKVTTGAVDAVVILSMGSGYSIGTSNTTGGTGTGCTILINELGSTLGRIVASGFDGTQFTESGNVQILSVGSGAVSSNIVPTTMSFFTTDTAGYYNETLKLSSDRAIKLPYNAGAITPAGTAGYITMWSGSLGTLNFRKGTGAIAGLSFPTGGDQTYSFPNVGIDSTLAILGAQTFTAQQTMPSVAISGTGGNGYLQLAWNTEPTGASNTTTIYANTLGKLSWKNGVSALTRTFDGTGIDVATTWTLPAKTGVGTLTLAGLETAQTFTAAQTFSTGITVSSGTSTFPSGASISSGGSLTSGGNINMSSSGAFAMTGSFVMSSPANGKITFMNGSSNDFGLIQFGGVTSTYPSFLTQYAISAQSITSFSTSGGTITTPSAHNLRLGDVITFTATSGLPSELTANSDYYVASVGSTTTFTVASSLGGSAITYASNTPTAPTFSRARAILCRSGEATTFASMARSSFYSGNHSINGTWTANSSSAQLLIDGGATTTNGFSANGTGLGINAASGFTGNIFDFKLNGGSTSLFKGDYQGNLTINNNFFSSGVIASNSTANTANINIVSSTFAVTQANSSNTSGYCISSAATFIRNGLGSSASSSTFVTSGQNYANTVIGSAPITATGTHTMFANLAVKAIGTITYGATFTVTAANATVGATYTNNGATFTVTSTISGATTLVCTYPSGSPSASGTLTKASGTGDATITFSSVVTGAPTNTSSLYVDGSGSGGTNNYAFYINSGNSYFGGKQIYDSTYINAGTTGDQTINKPSGSVNIAAGGSTIRVTNSFVTTSSIVLAVVMTNDTTAILKNVTVSSGQFTINLTAAATAETKIGFIVNN